MHRHPLSPWPDRFTDIAVRMGSETTSYLSGRDDSVLVRRVILAGNKTWLLRPLGAG